MNSFGFGHAICFARSRPSRLRLSTNSLHSPRLRSLEVAGSALAPLVRRRGHLLLARPRAIGRPDPILSAKSTAPATFLSTKSHGAASTGETSGIAAASPASDAASQPPLLVRVALVSSATALATPAFPALGLLYFVSRYAVKDANLRNDMRGRWGSLLSFTTWTLLPNLYGGHVASLILPCAIGNAVVAGAAYGLADVACGGPNGHPAMRNPLILGSGIGATVGYIAPNYLYGPVLEGLYGLDDIGKSVDYLMGFSLVTEASVATGALAGALLHPLLYYPVNGVPGTHWATFSGAALAAVAGALVYVYRGQKDAGLPVPEGSFVEPSKTRLLDAILRYNNSTKGVEAYSLSRAEFVGPPEVREEGRKMAEACRTYQDLEAFHFGSLKEWLRECFGGGGRPLDEPTPRRVVFDDRLLAFVYNYWDASARDDFAERIVKIESTDFLQERQDSMSLTDACVASILLEEGRRAAGGGADGDGPSADSRTLATIQELHSPRIGWNGEARPAPAFEEVGELSAAVALLMKMKSSGREGSEECLEAADVLTLELRIRKRCPALKLFVSDEECAGESVESQLKLAAWKGPELSDAIERWDAVERKERRQTWRRRAVILTSGALLAVAGVLLKCS